jgi:predicted O-methyltransferase YrrM
VSGSALAIEGMISDEELLFLERLARAVVPPSCIVEVGSYRGRSTAALAAGSRGGGGAPVYAIEPHERFTGVLGGQFGPEDRKHFFQNMLRAGATDEVRLVNLSSEIVAPGWRMPIGLLWIDGDHAYEGVRRDFEVWEPHLADGAPVAFHDSNAEGVARLLGELAASGDWTLDATAGLITVLKRA